MTTASSSFRGTDRFELVRMIGRGGMGVVYEAKDHQRSATVALKVLPNVTPERLLRFKREFRTAAEVQHENLVRLGDLIGCDDHWFFTMEMIHGRDVVAYVRGRTTTGLGAESHVAAITADSNSEPSVDELASAARPLAPVEEQRLRDALAQLARGLSALHAAGVIHRDVKPSNILVEESGRLVLLDFGLAGLAHKESTLFGAGTPLYMAPEQVSGPVDQAADWYAFGVLLFELLTGTLPFLGHSHLVILAKQGGKAPPVRARNPSAPADLASLCDGLLNPDPRARPDADEVLTLLGASLPALAAGATRTNEQNLLVGREREWQELERVFQEVRTADRPVALLVRGESGIGKSTLVRKYVEAATSSGVVLAFSGRCHERELVPYKAVDGLFDAVSQWLRHQRVSDIEELLPRRPGVLCRVFPVLGRIPAFARAVQPELAIDPHELRASLFTAARELLAGIARRKTLILYVDDLHWADRDSLALLSDVLGASGFGSRDPRASTTPGVLLLGTIRTAAGTRIPPRTFGPNVDERSLTLGALTSDASATLARQLMGAPASDAIVARRIAAESGGHPMFLRELVRQLGSPGAAADGVSLEAVLQARIARLEQDARQLLTAIAIAGAPLSIQILGQVSELSAARGEAARQELRAHGFLHLVTDGSAELLDVSHDRVRRAALSTLDAQHVRAQHAALAQLLEQAGDVARSAIHWQEADEPARAARHYLRAAELSAQALAFDDAVEHLSATLKLGTWTDDERRDLHARLGDALSNAGRGGAAAEHYRKGAQGAEHTVALELRGRAAGELMRSGYLDEGELVSREVLAEAGIKLASMPLLSLLLQRTWLRMRGLSFRERAPGALNAREIGRIDLCWSLSSGLVLTDHVQGAYLLAKGLALALRAGDPYRVARSLAAEAAFYAGFGARAAGRAYRLIEIAGSIARRLDQPELIGICSLMAGMAAHLGGKFAEAKAHLERAANLFRERCKGVSWELDACRQFWLECVYYLGELGPFPEAVAQTLKEAEQRGSMYNLANLRTGLANTRWLVLDQPERAIEESDAALSQWSGRGFHVQHWYQLLSRTQAELYLKQGEAAHRRVEGTWPVLASSHLLRLSHTRIVAVHLRARVALAAAQERPPEARAPLLALARKLARKLEREHTTWASALGALIVVGADALQGQPASVTRLGAIEGLLDRADLKLFRAALDTAQAEPEQLVRSGLALLGVREPQRFAHVLVPGLA